MTGKHSPSALDYFTVGAVSAMVLAYEIILLRVFSYSQWHHFASLAVALALLGFGVAGTALALLGKRAVRYGDGLFFAGMLIGATGMAATIILPHVISVRPLFAVWDAMELAKLLLVDFVAFVPFFGMALSIGQVFMRWPESTPKLYSVNLIGSGLGGLLAVLILSVLLLEQAVALLPCTLFALAAVFGLCRKGSRHLGLLSTGGTAVLVVWIGIGVPPLPRSDFKQLSYLLDLPDAQVTGRNPGLRDEITIVRSGSIRSASGLSLQWGETVPANDAMVLGSDVVIPFPREGIEKTSQPHLQATLSALPFILRPDGPVAILGTGDGGELQLASGRSFTWVEDNPQVVRLFQERGLPKGAHVQVVHPRGFSESSRETYGLLILAATSMGGEAATEDYMLTLEGVRSCQSLLSQEGLLVVPMKLAYPPRSAIRLIRLLKGAIAHDRESPVAHFAMLRSMQEALLVISKSPLSGADVQAIRQFSGKWGFDLVALPGMTGEEANRYHLLESPVFHDAANTIFTGEGSLPAEADWYWNQTPTDTRPYFWRSMKWTNLPPLLHGFGRQGLIWLDWSLLMTVVKLVVAAFLAAVLIVAPLGRLPKGNKPSDRWGTCIYFSMLGLGFLLLEMAVFQRARLFMGSPVTTAALVFSIFLIGAGIGSLSTPASSGKRSIRTIFFPVVVGVIIAYGLLMFAGGILAAQPAWMRLILISFILLPLAWTMGRAMPWGLRQLDPVRPLIPWAWGINGFASVLAAPAATLLSVHFSQPATWAAGLICYLVAWIVAGKIG